MAGGPPIPSRPAEKRCTALLMVRMSPVGYVFLFFLSPGLLSRVLTFWRAGPVRLAVPDPAKVSLTSGYGDLRRATPRCPVSLAGAALVALAARSCPLPALG